MALKNSHLHRSLDKEAFKKAIGYALVLSSFFLMVIFYVRQSIIKVQIENEISSQISRRDQLIQYNQELRLERGYLKSYSRIQRDARNRLGLINPAPNQLFFLKADSLLK